MGNAIASLYWRNISHAACVSPFSQEKKIDGREVLSGPGTGYRHHVARASDTPSAVGCLDNVQGRRSRPQAVNVCCGAGVRGSGLCDGPAIQCILPPGLELARETAGNRLGACADRLSRLFVGTSGDQRTLGTWYVAVARHRCCDRGIRWIASLDAGNATAAGSRDLAVRAYNAQRR